MIPTIFPTVGHSFRATAASSPGLQAVDGAGGLPEPSGPGAERMNKKDGKKMGKSQDFSMDL